MQDGTTRTLILLRHGKSGYPDGVPDHERPLAARGQQQAALAGAWLTEQLPPIDAIWCSTALRTRQTLQATGVIAPTRWHDRLYDASPGDVLAVLADTDPGARVVLVVGHVPGMPDTALTLADHDSDAGALRRMQEQFPTSAFAVLSVPGEWAQLAATGASVTDFVIARDQAPESTGGGVR